MRHRVGDVTAIHERGHELVDSSARWQAIGGPDTTSRKAAPRRATLVRDRQRVTESAAARGLIGLGTSTLVERCACAHERIGLGIADSSAFVYGCSGRHTALRCRELCHLPRYITATRSERYSTTDRSWR